MIVPPPLALGDLVRVVAPSGPFERGLLEAGVARLRKRYRVELGAGLETRAGFLAAEDAVRVRDLAEALAAPGVAAILAARGGYGLTRIAARIDWTLLRTAPRWLVGFSDATVLHLEALRVGVASWHAENVTGVGSLSDEAFDAWCSALAGRFSLSWRGLTCEVPGTAQGVLVGGNLSLLTFHALGGRVALPQSAIVALEDVGEAPYRVDRMLTALEQSGLLDQVGGFVLGSFVNCDAGQHGVPVSEVLRERLARYGVPVASGLPIGHEPPNRPLPLGRTATLDADAGLLTIASDAEARGEV